MSESANGFIEHNASMVEDFLELGGGLAALREARYAWLSHVHGIRAEEVEVNVSRRQLVRACSLKSLDGP